MGEDTTEEPAGPVLELAEVSKEYSASGSQVKALSNVSLVVKSPGLFVVLGPSGAGKTTLLNILGKFIPEDERILVIDETSEIRIEHKNLVRLEARQAQNGLPAVTIRELLRAALRHHPDRIILGEIRGQEAYELLQLLNTGQSGSLSTLHAPSPEQALARLTNCVLQGGVDLSYRAIKTSIGHSVNVVIQLERRPGRRFVSRVVEIKGFDADADEFDLSRIFSTEDEA